MAKRKVTSQMLVALFLILSGIVVVICSRPIFSYTTEKLEQTQRSENILNNTFNLHQFQDKMVKVQMAIGQTLEILATSNENFTFLIANYTNPENTTALNEPDIVYYISNGTLFVNTTWSPQVRTAEPGSYCLTFLARDFPPDSPVYVYANVTEEWTDIYTRTVVAPDGRSLVDSNYAYVGLGLVAVGGIILIHAYYRRH
jgi:hypothetical protein